MQQIRYLIWKEFKQIFRDRPMVALIFLMPIIQLFILGYAMTTEVKHVATVVCDLDRSQTSRQIVDKLHYSGYFDILFHENRLSNVPEYLQSGKAMVAVVIPEHFGRDLVRNRCPQIQLLVDGQDANSAGIALGYANTILQNFALEVVVNKIRANPRLLRQIHWVEPRVRVWYNPNLRSVNFMVPAVVAILLTMVTTMLTSMGIVREREIGTLEQLMVTPIKPYQLILGKTIPFAILGFVEIIIAMIVGKYWFRIPMAGNFLLLFGFAFVYLFTTLGIGIFISTLTSTQQQAMFIAWFFNVFAIIMSGFFIPIENMPKVLQYVAYLNPVRHFMIIVRAIFLKGATFQYLRTEGAIILIFGIVSLGVSSLRFQKRIR